MATKTRKSTKQPTKTEVKAFLSDQGVPDTKHDEVIGKRLLKAINDGDMDLANSIAAANPPDQWTNQGPNFSDSVGDADLMKGLDDLYGYGGDDDQV